MPVKMPALHAVADRASGRQQALYFGLISGEYAALVAVAAMSVNMIGTRSYIIVYGLFLAAALTILVIRTALKPEQRWYQARALAESVKTTSWKFAMGSRPFRRDGDDNARLRTMLGELLNANRSLGGQFDGKLSMDDQIPEELESIRALPWEDRMNHYMHDRVEDQLRWYARNAQSNADTGRTFAIVLGILYVVAFFVFLIRTEEPSWTYAHPDPIILLCASVLGWMQIKRFNELGASYALTANEIGIVKTRAREIHDDEGVSLFVDDAEEAFSREHTQWLARRSTLTGDRWLEGRRTQ